MSHSTIEEIKNLSPHRPPFFWVDEMVSWELLPNRNTKGHCRITLDREGHYFSENGLLRFTSLFEMISQAHCCVWAISNKKQRFSEIYLTSLREGKTNGSLIFQGGETLDIFTYSDRVLKEFCVFGGEVRWAGQELPLGTVKASAYYRFADPTD